jgi:hypothetical protein
MVRPTDEYRLPGSQRKVAPSLFGFAGAATIVALVLVVGAVIYFLRDRSESPHELASMTPPGEGDFHTAVGTQDEAPLRAASAALEDAEPGDAVNVRGEVQQVLSDGVVVLGDDATGEESVVVVSLDVSQRQALRQGAPVTLAAQVVEVTEPFLAEAAEAGVDTTPQRARMGARALAVRAAH